MTRADHYIRINDLTIHAIELGRGESGSVLALPGLMASAEMMVPFVERLTPDSRAVILDQRGGGLSGKPGAGYALDDYMSDAVGVMERLGGAPWRLVGHSLGARVAIKVGGMAASLVESLVLIDPPLSGPELGGPRSTSSPAGFLAELDALKASPTLETARSTWPEASDDVLAARATWIPLTRESAVVETYFQLKCSDDARALLSQWSALKVPTLLAYGRAEGGLIGPEQLATLEQAHSNLTVTGIERAGHQIPWENPHDLIGSIRKFWARPRQE